eukprot:950592-Karenia_brevis.AAC.1
MANRKHHIHPATTEPDKLQDDRCLSMSAAAATSGGLPPYMARGLALPFEMAYDSKGCFNRVFDEQMPDSLQTRGYKSALHHSE